MADHCTIHDPCAILAAHYLIHIRPQHYFWLTTALFMPDHSPFHSLTTALSTADHNTVHGQPMAMRIAYHSQPLPY